MKSYKRLQSLTQGQAQSRKNGLPIASLMLIACVVAESMQHCLRLCQQKKEPLTACGSHQWVGDLMSVSAVPHCGINSN